MKARVKLVGEDTIQIEHARLGYHALWRENEWKGKVTDRQVCTIIFSQSEVDEYKKAVSFVLELLRKKNKNVKNVNDVKYERFVRYEKGDILSFNLKTSNHKDYPATYIDSRGRVVRNPGELGIESKVFYDGCRVNCKIQFNVTEERGGDLNLWSNLLAIQFAGHDDRLGGLSDEEVASGFSEVDVSLPTSESDDEIEVTDEDVDDLFS